MDAWVIWLIAAVVAAVGEMLTLSFFLAPFAIGATLAMVLDLAGAPNAVSIGAFAVGTAGSFAAFRPVAARHRHQPPAIRTGTDALIGQTAKVLERVNVDGGSVKLAGEVWTARPYDDDDVFEEGVRVQVVKIQGAIALVSN